MSHIVTITTEVRDPAAIGLACQRLRLPEPVYGTAELFSGNKTGWLVRLPEWRYPIVCDTEQGKLDYDNYEGRWGDRVQLDRFLQGYAVEKAKMEACSRGHSVVEQPLSDDAIKLTVFVGEAS